MYISLLELIKQNYFLLRFTLKCNENEDYVKKFFITQVDANIYEIIK